MSLSLQQLETRLWSAANALRGPVDPATSAHAAGAILLTRLPKDDDEGDVDISDAAVLTHIRSQIVGEQNLSLSEGGGAEALLGMQGGGKGVQHVKDKVRLRASSTCSTKSSARN